MADNDFQDQIDALQIEVQRMLEETNSFLAANARQRAEQAANARRTSRKTIQQHITALQGIMSRFAAQKDQIQANTRFAQEYKTEQVAELQQSSQAAAVSELEALWGVVENDPGIGRFLSDGATAWFYLDRAWQALGEARDKVSTGGIDPAFWEVGKARMERIIRRAMTIHDVIAAYDGAPSFVRVAFQELGDQAMADKFSGQGQFPVFVGRLESDRLEREKSEEVDAAERALLEVLSDIQTARYVTEEIAHTQILQHSSVAATALSLFYIREHGDGRIECSRLRMQGGFHAKGAQVEVHGRLRVPKEIAGRALFRQMNEKQGISFTGL